jgi:ribose-phosphate pyrophosphokinase
VKSITYVSPFLPYTRQDRTFNLTGSLGAKIVAEIVNNCGIGKIITYDFHALQIEGFFKGQVHNLSAVPLFLRDIESKFDKKDIVIVFPDAGSASRFKRFFDNTDYEIAIIQKVRNDDGIAMKILGNASGKTALILDDMIDSGGTIIEASNVLKKQNANDIFVYATHGVLSGNAVQNLQNERNISKITITNSLQQNCGLSEKFEVIELDNV